MYTSYKAFPSADITKNIEKLMVLKKEEVESLYQTWKDIDFENIRIQARNRKVYEELIEEITQFLEKKGLKTYEYLRSMKKREVIWFKSMISTISRPLTYSGMPRFESYTKHKINGEDVTVPSGNDLIQIYDTVSHRIQREANANAKRNKLIAASYKYISENSIPFTGGPDQAIALANTQAGENWMKEKYPDGTPIMIDDNYCECGTFTVGEKRCACGNRRINIAIEGDMVDGFYYTAEPY